MNKLFLLLIAFIVSASVSAQEPEKKKDSKTQSSGTQERAINESGISVKSKPQTKSSSKEVQPPVPNSEDKKTSEQTKAAKKPD